MTMSIKETMLGVCENRTDEWGFEVLWRLQTCGDLVAAEARYHTNCYSYFKSGKPKTILDTTKKPNLGGRPVDRKMSETFEQVCE